MLFLCSRGPVRAPGRNAYFIRFLISALYTHHGVVVVYILFTCMFPHLSFFLHFVLTCLLPYLYFPLRIDPLLFQAGCRKKATKPGSRFFVFILCYSTFLWMVNVRFRCVRFSFSYKAKRLAWGNISEMSIFCVKWYVKPQLSQSISAPVTFAMFHFVWRKTTMSTLYFCWSVKRVMRVSSVLWMAAWTLFCSLCRGVHIVRHCDPSGANLLPRRHMTRLALPRYDAVTYSSTLHHSYL